MRDLSARVRAVITPQALLALAVALLLLYSVWPSGGEEQSSSLESQTSRVLSLVEGAGRVDVVIRMQREANTSPLNAERPEEYPVGAVAVAQGADDPVVQLELQQALCALLSLPATAVSIVTGGP